MDIGISRVYVIWIPCTNVLSTWKQRTHSAQWEGTSMYPLVEPET